MITTKPPLRVQRRSAGRNKRAQTSIEKRHRTPPRTRLTDFACNRLKTRLLARPIAFMQTNVRSISHTRHGSPAPPSVSNAQYSKFFPWCQQTGAAVHAPSDVLCPRNKRPAGQNGEKTSVFRGKFNQKCRFWRTVSEFGCYLPGWAYNM